MSEKADVSSVSPSSERSNEGLTLETSAFSLFMVANLCFQLIVNTRLPVVSQSFLISLLSNIQFYLHQFYLTLIVPLIDLSLILTL